MTFWQSLDTVSGLAGSFEPHIDSDADGKLEVRQWQKMKAETGDETKEEFERERRWKGMKLRGGGEKAQCQHSCELMNLSAHCGLYWTEPTQLKTHWTHCTNPHYYSPHWASPFTSSIDWLIYWVNDYLNDMYCADKIILLVKCFTKSGKHKTDDSNFIYF